MKKLSSLGVFDIMVNPVTFSILYISSEITDKNFTILFVD